MRSASAYVKPSSPSSVCPSQSSAVGGLRTIASGIPIWRASSRSCVLYRSPTGLMPHAMSPNCVPYPMRSEQAEHIRRAQRLGRERYRDRAVHATGDADHRAVQARFRGLISDEENEHLADENLVDPKR